MASYGKVIGGQHVNSTIDLNRKGELTLSAGFVKHPRLVPEEVATWEEVFTEVRGGAAAAVRNIGQVVAKISLPGQVGKAAAAAVNSTVDSVTGAPRTIRVDWVDGKQSLIQLPDKLFHHLALVLSAQQIASTAPATEDDTEPPSAVEGVIGQIAMLASSLPTSQPDITAQIAKLAALRDQGALTEDEFSAKKAELLSRM